MPVDVDFAEAALSVVGVLNTGGSDLALFGGACVPLPTGEANVDQLVPGLELGPEVTVVSWGDWVTLPWCLFDCDLSCEADSAPLQIVVIAEADPWSLGFGS